MTNSTFMPDGFRLMKSPGNGDDFVAINGPYYLRNEPDGRVVYGFRSTSRHANPNGVLHGGAIFSFLDTITGRMIVHATKRNCATIALDTRFVAPAPIGSWVEGRVTLKKTTKSMVFADAEATADGELVVTASAIFRVFSV